MSYWNRLTPLALPMSPEEFHSALRHVDIGLREFAALVGVHERTVRSWASDGSAPPFVRVILHFMRMTKPVSDDKDVQRAAIEHLVEVTKARTAPENRASFFGLLISVVADQIVGGSLADDPKLPVRRALGPGEVVRSIARASSDHAPREVRAPEDTTETPEAAVRITNLSEFRDRPLPTHRRLQSLRHYAEEAEMRPICQAARDGAQDSNNPPEEAEE